MRALFCARGALFLAEAEGDAVRGGEAHATQAESRAAARAQGGGGPLASFLSTTVAHGIDAAARAVTAT
jgi:hypothetical protein